MTTCRFSISSIRVIKGQGVQEGRLELSLSAGVHEQGDDQVTLTHLWSKAIGVSSGETVVNAEIARVDIAGMDESVSREVTIMLEDNDNRPNEDMRSDKAAIRTIMSVSKFNPFSKRVLRFRLKERPPAGTPEIAEVEVEVMVAKNPSLQLPSPVAASGTPRGALFTATPRVPCGSRRCSPSPTAPCVKGSGTAARLASLRPRLGIPTRAAPRHPLQRRR
jgi:hypothetical protein